jgi:FkbM family methyltransferase
MSWADVRTPSRPERLIRGTLYRLWGTLLPGRSITSPASVLGLRFGCHSRDAVGRDIFKRGVYEPSVLRALGDHLEIRQGDVAVDVGANVGWYSCILGALLRGKGRVVSLEPEPANFSLLLRNIAMNGLENIQPERLAASDVRGQLTLNMFDSSNRGRHSLLRIHEGRTISVPSAPLDEFLRERGHEQAPVALMKLDVEGYEPIVLRGAQRTLKQTRLVLAEWSPQFSRKGGIDPSEMLDILDQAGLSAGVIGPDGSVGPADRNELLECHEQRNLLFMRPGWRVDG